MFAVYLLPPCDICSVDGVDADTSAWRDGHTGQEARILVISIQDLHAQHNKCLELLLRVVFLFRIRNESVFFPHFKRTLCIRVLFHVSPQPRW